MLHQQYAVDMFCGHVTRIIRTQDLGECEILFPQSVLDPKVGSGEVPHLSKTSPPKDTNRSGGITHDLQTEFDA